MLHSSGSLQVPCSSTWWLLLLLLLIVVCPSSSATHVDTNITLQVPAGTTNHGDPHLLCTPAQWTDVVTFYVGNYIAHVATLITLPGETGWGPLINIFCCLLFPTAGIVRGLDNICRHAQFPNGFRSIFRSSTASKYSALQIAARSGALCHVVRSEGWTPEDGAKVAGIRKVGKIPDGKIKAEQSGADEPMLVTSSESPPVLTVYNPPWMKEASSWWSYFDTKGVDIGDRAVNGIYSLPKGYSLAFVPRNATVSRQTEGVGGESTVEELSSSYSWSKAAIALFQSLYASFTLFDSTGGQVRKWGYCSFNLTVAPYAVMSIVNLVGNLLTPDYATLSMIRSDIMDEAAKLPGAVFQGWVGELITITDADDPHPLEYANEKEDIEPKFSGVFEVSGKADAPLTRLCPDRASCKTTNIDENQEADLTSSSDGQKPLDLSIAQSSNDVEKADVLIMVPACPRFERTDSGDVARYFKQSDPGNAHHSMRPTVVLWIVILAADAIVLAIIYGLSRFRTEESTAAQRVWIMTWLTFGFFFGFLFATFPSLLTPAQDWQVADKDSTHDRYYMVVIAGLLFCAPAIGGFVVVGQMLVEYGNCQRIG